MPRRGRERVGSSQLTGVANGAEVRVDSTKLASLATVETAPPDELTPAQGGVVLAEGVRDEHKLAWLINAAIDCYVDIEGNGEHPTLTRRPAWHLPGRQVGRGSARPRVRRP